MRKALIFGVLLFLALVLFQAPAGLLRFLITESAPIAILEPRGTLWQGHGEFVLDTAPAGRLSWSLRGFTLLQGRLSYDYHLFSSDLDLEGNVSAGFDSFVLGSRGTVDASFVNRWLSPYDILLGGQFQLEDVGLTFKGAADRAQLEHAEGRLQWSGGTVQYILSNKMSSTNLPPLTALLGPGPGAVAFAHDDQTPLLHAQLQANGFARIGVTKQLTKLLGNPWPGGDADHAVVLEVEEQVF
jgi:hypothetical protein